MAWRDHFNRRRVLIIGTAAVIYAGLWMLTHRIGAPQVRGALVSKMPAEWTDVSQMSDDQLRHVKGPLYYCNARAYAPFLVRVEHGWHRKALYGDYADDLYCWCFGKAFRIYELRHWAE